MSINKNSNLIKGKYALIRITMDNVPDDVEFYGDPRFPYGFFTKTTIPKQALELFGEITYGNKYNYKNEKIKVLTANDTMVP